jgi:hypothetical protein
MHGDGRNSKVRYARSCPRSPRDRVREMGRVTKWSSPREAYAHTVFGVRPLAVDTDRRSPRCGKAHQSGNHGPASDSDRTGSHPRRTPRSTARDERPLRPTTRIPCAAPAAHGSARLGHAPETRASPRWAVWTDARWPGDRRVPSRPQGQMEGRMSVLDSDGDLHRRGSSPTGRAG